MSTQTVKFIDPSRNVVATARVAEKEERFTGSIDLNPMPDDLRRKFAEYEEIVNGQMFGLLDEIEVQIDAISLRVMFCEGPEVGVEDLQIYPSSKRVSFKLAKKPAQGSVPG